MSADLLPCPFCGGEADKWRYASGRGAANYAAACKVCHVSTAWGVDGTNAIEEWNRRAPVPAPGVALSERERFEAWATEKKWGIKPARGGSADDYMEGDTEIAWMGWQARAALDQAKPVAREVASERPTAASAGGLSLDTDYFRRKLAIITRDLSHYTAQEMARELVRLAKVANEGEAVKEAQGLADAKEGE